MVGSTASRAKIDDTWVLKLDATGAVTWQKVYSAANSTYAYAIQLTSDGGYIVAGSTDPSGTDILDAWVLKLDASGTVSWQKTYGGANLDNTNDIQPTSDGGYIVVGSTESSGAGIDDAWVIKLDAAGAVTWQKTYGGANLDVANSIQPTSDGGYIVAGYTDSSGVGIDDAWVIKLDAAGAVAWQKTYGGANSDIAYTIQPTSDGGYIVAGSTDSFGAGNNDAWILKLDSAGAVAWQKTYGSTVPDVANSIQLTGDKGYIVTGYTNSSSTGDSDVLVIKLDSDGTVAWQKTYGGETFDNLAFSIQTTSDDGYIVAGYALPLSSISTINAWVLKLSPLGDVPFNSASGMTMTNSILTVANSYSVSSNTAVVPADFIDPVAADTNVTSQPTDMIIETHTAPSGVVIAPTGLAASQSGTGTLYLSWTDGSTDESGFIVFRSTDNINFTRVSTVPAETSTYSDTGLTSGKTYYYKVEAYNASGYSELSDIATAVEL